MPTISIYQDRQKNDRPDQKFYKARVGTFVSPRFTSETAATKWARNQAIIQQIDTCKVAA